MPEPWVEQIRSTGMLSVHRQQNMTGDWGQVVQDAMDGFNAISTRENLGVTFVDAENEAQANVVVWTIDGTLSTTFRGTTYQMNIAGNSPIGHTRLYAISGRVHGAHMFLPSAPGRYPQTRGYGQPVRLVVAFHELVHCCGLHNSDHGHLAFTGQPSATRGSSPSEDRITVMSGGEYVNMPPLAIGSETCRKIRTNWAGSSNPAN